MVEKITNEKDKGFKFPNETRDSVRSEGGLSVEEIKWLTTAENREVETLRQRLSDFDKNSPLDVYNLNRAYVDGLSIPDVEKITYKGSSYYVREVPGSKLYPGFGVAGAGWAEVSQDLSPRVKRFVKAHEVYHLYDPHNWGGEFGQELRANFFPALRDPVGFLATAYETIKDPARRKYYFDRLRGRAS